MIESKLKKPLKLSDLKVGEVFDGIELILDLNENSMTTLSWQDGFENEREYDMRVFMYSIVSDSRGNIISVNNNGYDEVFRDDLMYINYANKLKKAGLFPEN